MTIKIRIYHNIEFLLQTVPLLYHPYFDKSIKKERKNKKLLTLSIKRDIPQAG